jgi:hypothetical protein
MLYVQGTRQNPKWPHLSWNLGMRTHSDIEGIINLGRGKSTPSKSCSCLCSVAQLCSKNNLFTQLNQEKQGIPYIQSKARVTYIYPPRKM